jgi:hypothetical protein
MLGIRKSQQYRQLLESLLTEVRSWIGWCRATRGCFIRMTLKGIKRLPKPGRVTRLEIQYGTGEQPQGILIHKMIEKEWIENSNC